MRHCQGLLHSSTSLNDSPFSAQKARQTSGTSKWAGTSSTLPPLLQNQSLHKPTQAVSPPSLTACPTSIPHAARSTAVQHLLGLTAPRACADRWWAYGRRVHTRFGYSRHGIHPPVTNATYAPRAHLHVELPPDTETKVKSSPPS